MSAEIDGALQITHGSETGGTMISEFLVLGEGNPLASLRVQGRRTLAAIGAVLMAATSPSVPSDPAMAHDQIAPAREEAHPPIWWQAVLYGTLLAAMLTNRY